MADMRHAEKIYLSPWALSNSTNFLMLEACPFSSGSRDGGKCTDIGIEAS